MNEKDALLAAIAANPDDDTARLVYADWLQEHGDEDRAEFIRLQIELARDDRSMSATRFVELKHREAKLLAEHMNESHREWLPAFATDNSHFSNPVFRRGFLDEVAVDVNFLLDEEHGGRMMLTHPSPTSVSITGSTAGMEADDFAVRLNNAHWLLGLTGLTIRDLEFTGGMIGLASAISATPNLQNVVHLNLCPKIMPDDDNPVMLSDLQDDVAYTIINGVHEAQPDTHRNFQHLITLNVQGCHMPHPPFPVLDSPIRESLISLNALDVPITCSAIRNMLHHCPRLDELAYGVTHPLGGPQILPILLMSYVGRMKHFHTNDRQAFQEFTTMAQTGETDMPPVHVQLIGQEQITQMAAEIARGGQMRSMETELRDESPALLEWMNEAGRHVKRFRIGFSRLSLAQGMMLRTMAAAHPDAAFTLHMDIGKNEGTEKALCNHPDFDLRTHELVLTGEQLAEYMAQQHIGAPPPRPPGGSGGRTGRE